MRSSMDHEQGIPSTATRRQFLSWGLSSGVGLSLAGFWRAQAVAESLGRKTAKIRSCIVVFYYGGPSHLDTFDLKPQAPAEVRGEFQPIATSVPGTQICEHLPRMARVMHKVAIVRSMSHGNRLHDSASTEALTGRQSPQGDREEFAPIPQFFPCHGATLSYLTRDLRLDVSHAALPWMFHNVVDVPCQGGGFLGAAYDPFRIDGNLDSMTYRSEYLTRPEDLTMGRIADRRRLLGNLEQPLRSGAAPAQSDLLRQYYDKAFDLLGSEAVRRALDITQEPTSMRERYGLGDESPPGATGAAPPGTRRNLRGQNLLLARRLVETGVPFVNVYDFKQQGQNWDSHSDNFRQNKDQLLPPADRALSALIEDLDQRGLLDTTLVVAMGEFGRTPKINANAGRDHWPDCYSLILAGGGIQGGAVYGASDRLGAFPTIDPVRPADLAATIYWRFGFNSTIEIHDSFGRPHRIADGQPLTKLFSS